MSKNYSTEDFKRWGQKGLENRYRVRYTLLEELRKHLDPNLYIHLPKWSTAQLKVLYKVFKDNKTKK